MSNISRPKRIVKRKLFPFNGDKNIWDKLEIDDETVSYISLPEDAENITKIIETHCKNLRLNTNNLTITDATSGAGGNVLSFSKVFKLVNAIEIDTKRYHFLTNNLQVYKIHNVNHYCDDCTNLIFNIFQDIIFFDPPWGGKEYKEKDNIRLKIGDISIEALCLKLMNKNECKYSPKMIALKLPKNYDIEHLHNSFKKINVTTILHSLAKMNVIIAYDNEINLNDI
ncbi:putative RNA methylase [Catovirus CTV1]|uniref:Putative RNA methylase n=1 Tax=Catovirus CTV1 TaxID=1977631 RepID=A0A1V0SC26_9VIRU|nr:putative RNA methylase [Catovirus CTV1]